MPIPLRADTAVRALIGPAVAVGDGFTPVTTLALGTADEAEIIKYNANTALAVTDISTGVTFSAITGADGYYDISLTASHTDTEGFLVVVIHDDSLILPIRNEFVVVNANVYDSLYAVSGTDVLDVNVTQFGGTAGTFSGGRAEVNTSHLAGTAQTAGDLMSSIGEENAAAAAGDPSTTESLMQYIKQLVNVLMGTTGITTWPASAAPGNGVSIAEALRAVYDDTNEIQVDTNSLNDTKIPDTISLANINTEVDNALNVTTYAEPGQGTPAATTTLQAKISYMYKFMRNRITSTSSAINVYNDDATTVDQKATFSDNGTTADRGEFTTGP